MNTVKLLAQTIANDKQHNTTMAKCPFGRRCKDFLHFNDFKPQ